MRILVRFAPRRLGLVLNERKFSLVRGSGHNSVSTKWDHFQFHVHICNWPYLMIVIYIQTGVAKQENLLFLSQFAAKVGFFLLIFDRKSAVILNRAYLVQVFFFFRNNLRFLLISCAIFSLKWVIFTRPFDFYCLSPGD